MSKEVKTKKNKRKINLTVYLTLRFLVILSMIGQAFNGNWNNVMLCILTLILFTFPTLISKKYKIKLPKTFEIIVYLFIYSGEILGEIQNFYGVFVHWDTILHTINGFLCGAIGFSLVDILNNDNTFHIKMTPLFMALVAFSFSMTIGVLWEFGEFTVDNIFITDMQKDRIVKKISSVKINKENENIPVILEDIKKTEIKYKDNQKIEIDGYLEIGLIDTMKDLFVNLLGAAVFSIIGYLYTKNRDKFKFIEMIIPKINNES